MQAYTRMLWVLPWWAVTGIAIAATLLLGGDGMTERSVAELFITSIPSEGRDEALVEHLISKGGRLGETGPEVWTVPQTQLDRLKQQLVSLV